MAVVAIICNCPATARGDSQPEFVGFLNNLNEFMPKKKTVRDESRDSATKSDGDQPSFEQALEELELIVNRLERGEGSLDEALKDYAGAIQLMRICRQKLEHAERRIEVLSGIDAEGNPIAKEYRDDAMDLDGKRQSRSERRTANPREPSGGRENSELF